MIRRTIDSSRGRNSDQFTSSQAGAFSSPDYRQKLHLSLGAGVEALKVAEIEAKVIAYFEANPSHSRDAAHVAAIACRFKKEQIVHRISNRSPEIPFAIARNRLC